MSRARIITKKARAKKIRLAKRVAEKLNPKKRISLDFEAYMLNFAKFHLGPAEPIVDIFVKFELDE